MNCLQSHQRPLMGRYRRILCDTPKMVHINLKLQTLKVLTPLPNRDLWYYDAHDEMSMELAKECVAAQTPRVDHVGCQSGVLEPWHEECRIHDL